MNEFDKEVCQHIGVRIQLVEKNESYFELLENDYPLGLNRIKWSDVLGSIELPLSDKIDRLKNISAFLAEIADHHHVAMSDEIVVWGDGAIENAYTMRFDDFLKFYTVFFDLPQHTYAWLKSVKKLINYTFEDELYFG